MGDQHALLVLDFKSHGKAATWDGHWKYPDGIWRVIVKQVLVHAPPGIKREELAPRFRELSDDDLHICGAYVLAANSRS